MNKEELYNYKISRFGILSYVLVQLILLMELLTRVKTKVIGVIHIIIAATIVLSLIYIIVQRISMNKNLKLEGRQKYYNRKTAFMAQVLQFFIIFTALIFCEFSGYGTGMVLHEMILIFILGAFIFIPTMISKKMSTYDIEEAFFEDYTESYCNNALDIDKKVEEVKMRRYTEDNIENSAQEDLMLISDYIKEGKMDKKIQKKEMVLGLTFVYGLFIGKPNLLVIPLIVLGVLYVLAKVNTSEIEVTVKKVYNLQRVGIVLLILVDFLFSIMSPIKMIMYIYFLI